MTAATCDRHKQQQAVREGSRSADEHAMENEVFKEYKGPSFLSLSLICDLPAAAHFL